MAKIRIFARGRLTMQIDAQTPMPHAQACVIFIVVPRINMATLIAMIAMIKTMRVANCLALWLAFLCAVVLFDGPKQPPATGGRPR